MDKEGDRCVLQTRDGGLAGQASRSRRYSDLQIGERVYTVGSPQALDRTLGEGIISGLRSLRGIRHIQTTAPISPGSSGGGLFDRHGNLIGITTFLLKDSQSLNFAISVDEFER